VNWIPILGWQLRIPYKFVEDRGVIITIIAFLTVAIHDEIDLLFQSLYALISLRSHKVLIELAI
jgi:hypothetical protein